MFVRNNVTLIIDWHPRATTGESSHQNEDDWKCVPTLVKMELFAYCQTKYAVVCWFLMVSVLPCLPTRRINWCKRFVL